MKKILIAALLMASLTACGKKEATAPVPEAPKSQAASAANLCPESMGVSGETVILNIEKNLKSMNNSTKVIDKSVTKNECGSAMVMQTKDYVIQMILDNQNQLLQFGVGYEEPNDVTANAVKLLGAIQVIVSPVSTTPAGEMDEGKKLAFIAMEAIQESKKTGASSRTFDFEQRRYTINMENKAVAIVVRKPF